MVELAWFIGFWGNLGSSFVFFSSGSILNWKSYKKRDYPLLLAGISLYFLAAMAFSIVLLYWQQNQFREDLNNFTSIWPFFMWFTNLLFVEFLFWSIIRLYFSKKSYFFLTGLLILHFITGFFNGIWGLSTYEVWWRGGNVLVYYVNKQAELLNSILHILAIAGCFYLTIGSFLENKKAKDLWLSLAFLINLFMFFIPRTEPWSITNPVTVKILALIFFYLFLGFFMIAWLFPEIFMLKSKDLVLKMTPKTITENISQYIIPLKYNKTKYQLLLIISAMGISLLVLGGKLLEGTVKMYETAADAVNEGQAFFFDDFLNKLVFIHFVGALIPILISFVFCVYVFIVSTSRRYYLFFGITLLICQIFLSIFFNQILHLGFAKNDVFSPFILGFIIPPLAIPFLSSYFIFTLNKELSFYERLHFQSMPAIVYSCTVVSTVIIDLFLSNSPTGKILIGGGSLFDGVFILPILNVLFVLFLYSLLSLMVEMFTEN